MTTNKQPLGSAQEAALCYAKSVTIDQLHAVDQIVQSSKLFSRNSPGYEEARLVIAQMVAQNYIAAVLGGKG